MLAAPLTRTMRRATNGSALVVVLFFVILLTIVTIAFLTRSLTAVKVSASSAGETKSKILASSASDIIVGDLKQEIVAGSASVGADARWPVYTPNSNLTAIPFQNGVPAANAVPNLVSRSVSPANTGGSAPYVAYTSIYTAASIPPNRAASDPSATTYTTSKVSTYAPSLNGRFVSPAQWNAHYLIPRATPANPSTTADATPVAAFIPPDWVVVTRNGATSVSSTTPGFSTGGLADPTLTNTNFAIGRYAYAVYNEGGLLDMNVAGYPSDPTTPGAANSNGLTTYQSSQKSGVALADLTQLTVASTALAQTQINDFVGWRNYASAELTTGTYPTFTFAPANASDWLTNFVFGNTNGYLQITPALATVTTPPTDQALLSRQQLISIINSLGISPDFLQYMGTFSRALEQPSTVPDSSRPLILTTGGSPPAASAVDSYTGNNDQQGQDATVNPSFLSIRVAAAFPRWNGATAVAKEPLVKTKFALSWLRLVAYNAWDANSGSMSLPSGFAATVADPEPIYDRFGLRRANASVPWVYNHGQSYIMSLTQVAAANREPDFAELLKACIVAGSLGKAAPNIHNGQENYQYTLDAQVDYQVIQIMANLIDQQDADSYPTVIQINNSTQGLVTVAGVEDVPYFYRFHLFSVVDRLPVPLISKTASMTFTAVGTGVNTTGSTTMATTYPAGGAVSKSWTAAIGTPSTYLGCQSTAVSGALTDQGEATLLYVPDVWNPHDPNTVSTSSLRPAAYRICAATTDPAALWSAWTIGAESKMYGPNTTGVFLENDGANPPATYYWPVSGGGLTATAKPTTWPLPTSSVSPNANAALTFSDNGGTLFREPTMLWNANPTGISISGPNVKDINTKQVYYGFNLGKTPISIQASFTSTPMQGYDGSYIFQGSSIAHTEILPTTPSPGNPYDQITILLQYQDPANSSNWITYDVKYPEVQHTMSDPSLTVNTADYSNGSWQNPLANSQFTGSATVMDPRTARWGVGTGGTLGEAGETSSGLQASSGVPYVLEPYAYANFSTYANMKATYFNMLEDNRPRVDPGNVVFYSNPCMTTDPNGSFGSATLGFRNLQMRFISPGEFRMGSGYTSSPGDFDGLFSQNNPALSSTTLSQNGTAADKIYQEDADGVARLAMGGYATTNLSTGSTVGLPLVTASTFNNNSVGTATAQSQSRPIILNRPFRSVSEMSYAFRGSPWKNIDFFTPASGDSAMLDTFCLTEPPPTALVAGKVDLNTRNIPVLQALVAGAYVDEVKNAATTPPTYALPALTGAEAKNVATTLETITSDSTHAWRGPLKNISGLAGRFIASPGTTTDTDLYTYLPPALSVGGSPSGAALPTVNYAGLSSALDCSSFNGIANHCFANSSTPLVQRFRESAIRPLAAAGQVRVWNLLLDVVAQTGHYPKSASSLDQFFVDGQTHLWVHVAIDRSTGQVLDKQVEVVTP